MRRRQRSSSQESSPRVAVRRALRSLQAAAMLPRIGTLTVWRVDGSELLVPMVGDCVRSVDLSARRIDVDLGFLGEG